MDTYQHRLPVAWRPEQKYSLRGLPQAGKERGVSEQGLPLGAFNLSILCRHDDDLIECLFGRPVAFDVVQRNVRLGHDAAA